MSQKILVIDDETQIVQICSDYIRAAGFEVITAEDGVKGLALARQEQPNLIVLDIMMPEMNGLDFLRTIRREVDVPVILLSARVDESDKLVGLELGADDYITKPFSPRELIARIRTVLRRVGPELPEETTNMGKVFLDRAHYQLQLPDRTIDLTPTEFEILAILMNHKGVIFSRAQLLKSIRGVSFESYERAIDSHIRNIRRKLEPENYIVTVHGIGYKFEE